MSRSWVENAEEFGELNQRHGDGSQLALLVACSVELGTGTAPGMNPYQPCDSTGVTEQGKVSATEFARRAKTTAQTVLRCRRAWEQLANRGIVQIHTGPLKNVAPMGPWLNVMDPTFHLHLRADHIAEAWAVRKPTKDGHVTSVEAYDKNGEMIIQFFGKRKEGNVEMAEWRALVEGLPTTNAAVAA